MLMNWKTQYSEIASSFQIDLKIQCNPSQLSNRKGCVFVCGWGGVVSDDKLILKVIRKGKEPKCPTQCWSRTGWENLQYQDLL